MIAEGGTKSLSYDQVLEAFYPIDATLDGGPILAQAVPTGARRILRRLRGG